MKSYHLFISQNWPLLCFGFVSVFWGNLGQSFFISWYGAGMQMSLGLSATAYGSIYSGATLLSAIVLIFAGSLIDRVPLKKFALVSAVSLFIACIIMSVSHTIPLLALGLFLIRLSGQGLLPHTAQTTMARYFNKNRGKALSISLNGVPVGEALLPLLAVTLIALIGWRLSWLVFAISIIALYIPTILWLLNKAQMSLNTSPEENIENEIASALGRKDLLIDYRFWLALPAVLAAPFMITGVFIHQNFILHEKNWDVSWLASCFIIMGITHAASAFISGYFVDKLSACRLLPFMLTPLICATLTLAFIDGYWAAPLLMALLGISIGTTSPILGALWAEVYGTKNIGAIRSLITSTVVLSTAISPVLFGFLIDQAISVKTLFLSASLGIIIANSLVYFSYGFPRRQYNS